MIPKILKRYQKIQKFKENSKERKIKELKEAAIAQEANCAPPSVEECES